MNLILIIFLFCIFIILISESEKTQENFNQTFSWSRTPKGAPYAPGLWGHRAFIQNPYVVDLGWIQIFDKYHLYH